MTKVRWLEIEQYTITARRTDSGNPANPIVRLVEMQKSVDVMG